MKKNNLIHAAVMLTFVGMTQAGEPPHMAIEQAYFKCDESKSLKGGIFGKGPLKSIGPVEAPCNTEEWIRITKAEFKKLATVWHQVEWDNEIEFWQRNE